MTLIEKVAKTLLEENEKRYIAALKISIDSIADPTKRNELFLALSMPLNSTHWAFIEQLEKVLFEENKKRYDKAIKSQEVETKLLTDQKNTIIEKQAKETIN